MVFEPNPIFISSVLKVVYEPDSFCAIVHKESEKDHPVKLRSKLAHIDEIALLYCPFVRFVLVKC